MELKKYSELKDYESVISYFLYDNLALDVWLEKYALRNKNGELLEQHPQYTYLRIAKTLASYLPKPRLTKRKIWLKDVKSLSNAIFIDLYDKRFCFGGSVLFGLGNPYAESSLANCFVIHNPEDSYGSIMKTDEEQIQLMKRRGGVGHDISHLRPKGSKVNNAAKTSTGATSFMERYSNSTREVAQEGRRGALMLTMDVNHQDIKDFITKKSDLTKVTGANISVKLTDDFMYKVALRTESEELETFKLICEQAWKTGEPGVVFWDTILNASPADNYEEFKTVSLNPCGEIPLSPYDSCRLGHININSYVNFTKGGWKLDAVALERGVIRGQLYMDLLVSAEADRIKSIIEKIKRESKREVTNKVELELWTKILKSLLRGRRTGLGILGLADALVKIGDPYASTSFNINAGKILRLISTTSYTQSIAMAKRWGPFKAYKRKIDMNEGKHTSEFIFDMLTWLPKKVINDWTIFGRRNISNLTIAPTGSVSILAGTTSGMEPVFKIYYRRRRKLSDKDSNLATFTDKTGDKWIEYNIIHSDFIRWYAIIHLAGDVKTARDYLSALPKESLDEIISNSPYFQSEAHNVAPHRKLELQGRLQQFIDHSISMTVNLPQEATVDEVFEIYEEAWRFGCKGVTIYRDGCRDGILLSDSKKDEIIDFRHDAPKRPKTIPCDVHFVKIKDEHYVIIVGLYNDIPFEVFGAKFETKDRKLPESKRMSLTKIQRGVYQLSDGEDVLISNITDLMSAGEEVITRLASMGLRHGADIKFIAEQLSKTKEELSSFSKILARTLKKYIKSGELVSGNNCPECNSDLVYEGGCVHCSNCTYEICH